MLTFVAGKIDGPGIKVKENLNKGTQDLPNILMVYAGNLGNDIQSYTNTGETGKRFFW